MKSKKSSGKGKSTGKRVMRDLAPRKRENVKGGGDAASGLPTGKRQHKPLVIT